VCILWVLCSTTVAKTAIDFRALMRSSSFRVFDTVFHSVLNLLFEVRSLAFTSHARSPEHGWLGARGVMFFFLPSSNFSFHSKHRALFRFAPVLRSGKSLSPCFRCGLEAVSAPRPTATPACCCEGQNVGLALSPSGFDCSRESAWSLDFGDWANPT